MDDNFDSNNQRLFFWNEEDNTLAQLALNPKLGHDSP